MYINSCLFIGKLIDCMLFKVLSRIYRADDVIIVVVGLQTHRAWMNFCFFSLIWGTAPCSHFEQGVLGTYSYPCILTIITEDDRVLNSVFNLTRRSVFISESQGTCNNNTLSNDQIDLSLYILCTDFFRFNNMSFCIKCLNMIEDSVINTVLSYRSSLSAVD